MAGIGGIHGVDGGSMFTDRLPVVLDAKLTDIYQPGHPVQYVIRASVDADLLPEYRYEVGLTDAVGQFDVTDESALCVIGNQDTPQLCPSLESPDGAA